LIWCKTTRWDFDLYCFTQLLQINITQYV